MLKITECPVETTMSLIGGKWKILILKNLFSGKKRYGELKKGVPGVSSKVLTDQLNDMIADHLVKKTIFAEVPPRTEYELTQVGFSLLPIVNSMKLWGDNFKLMIAGGELEQYTEEKVG